MTARLCPEAGYRASLSDPEFWDYVLNGHRPGDPVDDYDPDDDDNHPTGDEAAISTPCPECGQVGALRLRHRGPGTHPHPRQETTRDHRRPGLR